MPHPSRICMHPSRPIHPVYTCVWMYPLELAAASVAIEVKAGNKAAGSNHIVFKRKKYVACTVYNLGATAHWRAQCVKITPLDVMRGACTPGGLWFLLPSPPLHGGA